MFCVLGIITNVITMRVIRNNASAEYTKMFANLMYKHIQMNAMFNIAYCVIKLCSLVNICIYPRTSYCSSVYRTVAAQYFKIYVVYFAGSAVKMCVNFSYVCFSISRFYLSTSSESHFFEIFRQFSLRRMYVLVFAACLSFSGFKVAQYRANDFPGMMFANYPFDAYSTDICNGAVSQGPVAFLRVKCKVFASLNMLDNILNNVLFFLASIVIDISMVRFTQQTIIRKKRLLNSDATSLRQTIEVKHKVNKMILTNGLLYFVSHVPEFVVTLLLIAYAKTLEFYCLRFFSCVELSEMAQACILWSISLQFFVFKHFDKNFNQSLMQVLGREISESKPSETAS